MSALESLMCWFNGELIQLSQVKVSVFDFGFIHSDATYDVFRAREGKIMHFYEHELRFRESCEYFGFKPIADMESRALELLKLNSLANAFVWACVWRGQPPSGSPRDVSGCQNSLIYVKPYYPLSVSPYMRLMIHSFHRRVPEVCYSQKSKNFGWIELTFAQKNAIAKGFDSALVLTVEGCISEGPGFGVCFVKDGKVFTPLKDCLGSVTIQIIENICTSSGIPFERKDIYPEEAYAADEAFACSTSGGITFISNLDQVSYHHELSAKIKSLYESS